MLPVPFIHVIHVSCDQLFHQFTVSFLRSTVYLIRILLATPPTCTSDDQSENHFKKLLQCFIYHYCNVYRDVSYLIRLAGRVIKTSTRFIGGGSMIFVLQNFIHINVRWYFQVSRPFCMSLEVFTFIRAISRFRVTTVTTT